MTARSMLELEKVLFSQDGTQKYLWRTHDNYIFESVLLDLDYRPINHVICVSTQIGCPVGCKFCSTALLKYHRNLTPEEIIGQIEGILRENTYILKEPFEVSFMGMGEPLLNWHSLLATLYFLEENFDGNIESTVSTAGIIPRIYTLANKSFAFPVDLQISLHATTDVQRDELIPINKVYRLHNLIEAGKYYAIETRRKVCINYLLLNGVNDFPHDADNLTKLLDPELFYVKLSHINDNLGSPFRSSPSSKFEQFRKVLEEKGIQTKIFLSRGTDIKGGCGQLALHQPTLQQSPEYLTGLAKLRI